MTAARPLLACLGALSILAAASAQNAPAPGASNAPIAATPDVAYGIGYDLGATVRQRLEADGVTVDDETLLRGMRDALAGAQPAKPRAELDAALSNLEKHVSERHARQRYETDPVFRALADDNERRGAEFRADYARREGVASTPNGALIRVLRSGDAAGPQPKASDTVTLTFTGRLIDNVIYAQGHSADVRVDSIMEGGQALLMRMRPGDRWEVVLPPSAGLGLAGRAGEVGPNETLIIDVELLAVRPNE